MSPKGDERLKGHAEEWPGGGVDLTALSISPGAEPHLPLQAKKRQEAAPCTSYRVQNIVYCVTQQQGAGPPRLEDPDEGLPPDFQRLCQTQGGEGVG